VITIADRFTLNENKSHYFGGVIWLDLSQWSAVVAGHALACATLPCSGV